MNKNNYELRFDTKYMSNLYGFDIDEASSIIPGFDPILFSATLIDNEGKCLILFPTNGGQHKFFNVILQHEIGHLNHPELFYNALDTEYFIDNNKYIFGVTSELMADDNVEDKALLVEFLLFAKNYVLEHSCDNLEKNKETFNYRISAALKLVV